MSRERSEHKSQHFVPQGYLSAWVDPNTPDGQEGYVWLFDKSGERSKNKSPRKIFQETDFYTIHRDDGSRDLRIEHTLNHVETEFQPARARLSERDYTDFVNDMAIVLNFAASIKARTQAVRDHQRAQWAEPLKMLDELQTKIDRATPEERLKMAAHRTLRGDGPSISHEELRTLHDKPIQNTFGLFFPEIVNQYAHMSWALLYTDDLIGFVTSDNPCVWFDPQSYLLPRLYRSPALGSATIEVSLPLAPNLCLFLSRSDFSGIRTVPGALVDEINRRTRFNAYKHFVVRTNEKKAIWFDRGKPPESRV